MRSQEAPSRPGCSPFPLNVAFPSISTGIYGYPVSLAATKAVATVASFLSSEPMSPSRVRFVLFDAMTFATYAGALDEL